jgi:signal transduction histidine kinase
LVVLAGLYSMKRDGSVLLERRRISRDLHDSTIQPYLGLKWALEAIQTKSAAGRPILEDLARLVARVDHEILLMRRYVSSLQEPTEGREFERAPVELPLVFLQQVTRWRELYRLEVLVRTTGPGRMVSDLLASTVLNIANEGLSNIRRHTLASNARITLFCGIDQIRIVIVNPVAPGVIPTPFMPRSIDERARALGGRCETNSVGGRETRVAVELPRRVG